VERVIALVAVFLPVAACGCSSAPVYRDVVFQASTLDALMTCAYDGQMTCGALRRHGDLGLGTLDALDGEMAVLDGMIYRVRSDGRAEPAPSGPRAAPLPHLRHEGIEDARRPQLPPPAGTAANDAPLLGMARQSHRV